MAHDFVFKDRRLERAVLICVARLGVEKVTLMDIADQLGRSRSSMYREIQTAEAALAHTHRECVDVLASAFFPLSGDRRAQFEKWWHEVVGLLRSDWGAAFRQVRSRVACGSPAGLLRWEVERLSMMRAWMEDEASPTRAAVLTQVAWELMLDTASWDVASPEETERRELAWSMISPERTRDEPIVEESAVEALGELL